MVVLSKAERKERLISKLEFLLQNYQKMIIVEADNVRSKQMAMIRYALRGRAVLLMGKNTLTRMIIQRYVSTYPGLESLLNLIKLNVGIVFCIGEPADIRRTILSNVVPAPARQGVVAPVDVTIPAGATGLDPTQTGFFQALGIPTKVVKGQIEIQSSVHLIVANEKVTASAATLCQKLGIMPFSYGLKPTYVYDEGSTYSSTVLDISNDDIKRMLVDGIKNVAAVSRSIGFPTAASTPHCLVEGFKNCVSLCLNLDFTFPEMQKIRDSVGNE